MLLEQISADALNDPTSTAWAGQAGQGHGIPPLPTLPARTTGING